MCLPEVEELSNFSFMFSAVFLTPHSIVVIKSWPLTVNSNNHRILIAYITLYSNCSIILSILFCLP